MVKPFVDPGQHVLLERFYRGGNAHVHCVENNMVNQICGKTT